MNLIQKKELLRLWKQKIANVPTRRIEIKNQLISLATLGDQDKVEEKYHTFVKKRAELLSDNHQQGFTWEPHFQWALDWLTYFLPAGWRFFKGSALRQALLEAPLLEQFNILDERDLLSPAGVQTDHLRMEQTLSYKADTTPHTETYATLETSFSDQSPTEQQITRQVQEPLMHTSPALGVVAFEESTKDEVLTKNEVLTKSEVFMTESEFEQALLHNPRAALLALDHQLDAISETTDQKELAPLFERLDLIKTSVDPLVYYHLLEKLYQHQPLNTLSYFYSLYQSDPKEMPNSYEFIEQHLWAKTVMDLFVKHSATPVYTIQLLLILSSAIPSLPTSLSTKNSSAHLLLGKGKQPIDFFGELFKLWSETRSESPINLLLTVYNNKKRYLQEQIEPLLGTNTKQNRELNSRFSVAKGDGSSYMQMLEDILDYIKPVQHPFLKHLARQGAEQLLATYCQNADQKSEHTWHKGHEGAETFRLIGKILGKPAIIPAAYNTYLSGLDPFTPTIPIFPINGYDFQHAERYAVEIILGALISPEMALLNARRIKQMYVQIKNPSPFIISWIVKRVTPFCPTIVADLKYVLGEVAIYGTEDLPSHEITDFCYHPAELEKQIEEQFTRLLNASKNHRAKEENEASAILLNRLIQLIDHPKSRPDTFDKAHSFIAQFKNYLSDNLKAALEKQIQLRQKALCQWEKSTLGAFEPGDEEWTMEKVRQYKLNASLAGSSNQFQQEYRDSLTAVNAFVVALEKINPHDLDALREANAVLVDLQVYLTDNQYQEWHQQIGKLIHDCPRDLKPSPKQLASPSPQFFAHSAKISHLPADYLEDRSKKRI